ncbi:MAG: hypothetical protein K2M02_06900 [Duncaniella sp.]|nr:hypothetical protein [Duncaniella sp.]MDE6325883.1 hypothetical protein [Duncaniella sp.]
MKENDEIKELFAGFNPPVGDSRNFMNRLSRNLDTIDLIKKHNIAVRRVNRMAAVIAVIAGFAAGVAATMLLPVLKAAVGTVEAPGISFFLMSAPDLVQTGLWLLVGVVSVLVTLSAYDVSAGLLKARQK